MRDAIEIAYRTAEGQCIDALYALHRLNGSEALDYLKAAIRSIERGQRTAEQERRRERIVPAPPMDELI